MEELVAALRLLKTIGGPSIGQVLDQHSKELEAIKAQIAANLWLQHVTFAILLLVCMGVGLTCFIMLLRLHGRLKALEARGLISPIPDAKTT